MNKKILFIASVLIGANIFAQPALDWAQSVGVDPFIGYSDIRRMHIDANDNIYHAVQFDTDDYHPDPLNSGVVIAPFGYTSAIVKYDTDGNYLSSIPLHFTATHSYQMKITGITSDATGNIYITGMSPQEFDANPGPGISLVTPFNAGSNYNMFIIKYSPTGTFLWSVQYEALPGRVAIGPNGNLFVTGYGGMSFIDFDPGSGVVNATNFGGEDAFLLELNPSGNFVDVISFGGTGNEKAVDLAFDTNGNIFITGNYFRSTAGGYSQFDPQGSGTQYTTFAMTNVYDGYLLKLNNNKVFQWVKVFEGQEASTYSSIDNYSQEQLKINSQNDVVLTFGHQGSVVVDFNSGTPSPSGEAYIYVMSFDYAGNQLNVISFREDNQYFASTIEIGANDAVLFLTGFLNSIDIDPETSVQTLTSASYGAAFAKFSSNLTLDWAYGFDQAFYPTMKTNSANEILLSFINNNGSGIDVDLSTGSFVLDYNNGDYYNAMIKYYECLPINETVINSSNVLTASQSGGVYQWVDCNNSNTPISGATSQSYTPTVAGNFACEITIGSCTYLSDCATSTVGIDENLLENTIRIYPNPSNGRILIINENNIDIDYLEVLDVSGRIVGTETINNSKSELNLEPGTYFLKLFTNNQKQSIHKVIISN